MSISTTTHVNFRGTARRALEFYCSVFGGHVTVLTYGDVGMPQGAPGADAVIFGRLTTEDGLHLMAYDLPGHGDGDPAAASRAIAGSTRRENGTTITDRTFFQSLQADDLDELTVYWHRLAEEGTVIEPLAASEWSSGFGMVTDRFGVTWILDVRAAAGR